VVLHVVNFSLRVDPFEGVRGVPIHMSEPIWSASIRKQDHDLVLGLWSVLPEVEGHVRVMQVSLRISFLGVNEVWEFNWVVDEKHRGVVSNEVVVSLFSVELDSKASGVSSHVAGTKFSSDSRESCEDRSPFAHLVQESSLSEGGHIFSHFENSVSSSSFSVDNSLWNSLSIKVSEFVDESKILEEDGSSRSSSH
jgi:hypothetical protein